MEETRPLIRNQNVTVLYTRRWWMLAVFSFSCFMQTLIWNTWGPIAQSAKTVYGWSDGTIGLIPSLGNIACMCTVLLNCYFMDEKGLRISAVLCSGLIFAASGLRCITSDPEYATGLMYASAIINGVAGTTFFSGPPLLASLWFPLKQRTTATAISSLCIYAGLAAGFLIGPQLVSAPIYNTTVRYLKSDVVTPMVNESSTVPYQNTYNETALINFEELRNQVMWLMYVECIAAAVGFFATLLYFPDKPPTPPSNSANEKRIEYKKAVCQIIRHGPLWLISIAFALPIGVYAAWGAILDVILHPVGVSQEEAGWIGFYATVGGCIAGVVIARFSDLFLRHMKLFLLCLYMCGGASFVWFTLVCDKIVPYSTAQLYISSIAGGIFLNGTIPLFYELSCETSYPIAEGITGAFSTMLDSIFGVLFLFVLQIPNIGTTWMNWCLVGSIVAGILVLLIFRESYRRTDLDITIVVKPSDCVDKIDENFNKQEQVDADFIHKRNICAENGEHAE
ncbi:MFS transporter, FLVCR family, disrupted in renal carcinoma protein 2 [Mytilus galloprovincialis]|uniref:MFS transporter, FLVCR family, disrupted in renal carcinoma protein 2 n=1 Tax=Mytilus galloprovincialis TaxID=29158 RepID=A0A8B6G4P0_MYTGA|nr:MFS transporter, FLVCR family, disrupted in renal carcinoma protein 2 [Mytilus galloprovincialis]